MLSPRRSLFAAALLLLAAAPAAARAQDDTPEGVVRRAIEARDRGDWAAVAALVRPATLEQLREMIVRDLSFRAEVAAGRVVTDTVTPGLDGEPVPACVREFFDAQRRAMRTRGDPGPEAIYGTADSLALRRMPAAELFVRQAAWRARVSSPSPAARVVGSLPVDDSSALVFVRHDGPDWEGQPQLTLVEVRRSPEWRLAEQRGHDVLGWGFGWWETSPGEGPAEVPAAEGSPAAVVLRAAEAARAEDWRAVAALVHPRVLETVQRGQARMMTTSYAEFAEEGARAPDATTVPAPECVTAYFAAQLREAEGERKARIVERFGTSDRAALLALPAAEFFARYLAGLDSERSGGPPAAYRPTRLAAVGTVTEGDSLAHVALREVFADPGMHGSNLQVVSVRRAPDGWRLATADAPFFYRRP